MILSYSAAAKPAQESAPADIPSTDAQTESQSAEPTSSPAASGSGGSGTGIQHLILDAGPLLSLTPLRHLAQHFHTTPMVLAELRDPKAREHWQRLGLSGVNVTVEPPKPDVMARVVAFAKKTGDYSVLSQTDMSVIALTCQYELEANGEKYVRSEPGEKKAGPPGPPKSGKSKGKGKEKERAKDSDIAAPAEGAAGSASGASETKAAEGEDSQVNELSGQVGAVDLSSQPATATGDSSKATPMPEEEDDSDDGGDWITPTNVSKHRSRDLGLLPSEAGSDQAPLAAACMTGDYAVQNVLLSMGLGLVGEAGKRINQVKSFILRCHACFKTCNDLDKRFCPSCGNPTLLRTTVSTSAKTGKQTIHLKKNFQYHLRGTKFSIPDAKPGRSKGQQKAGNGLIMREDQREWQDAVKAEDIRRQKEERKLAKGTLDGWDDPDWLPEIITVGMSGKGRSGGHNMPKIGHGRSNPNVARRKR